MFGFLNHKIIFFSLPSLHSLSFKPLTEVVWFVVLTVFHSLFYSCGGEAVKHRRRRLCSSDSDAGFTNEYIGVRYSYTINYMELFYISYLFTKTFLGFFKT